MEAATNPNNTNHFPNNLTLHIYKSILLFISIVSTEFLAYFFVYITGFQRFVFWSDILKIRNVAVVGRVQQFSLNTTLQFMY